MRNRNDSGPAPTTESVHRTYVFSCHVGLLQLWKKMVVFPDLKTPILRRETSSTYDGDGYEI